jgi:hypothetical protein
MSIQEKRYLDYEGLSSFFTNLKSYYLDDSAVKVGYAGKANRLATPVNVSFTFGNMALGQLQNFDGSADGSVELNLSDFALKSDIAAALNFKGVVNYKKDLPDGTTGHEREAGDIYIVRYYGSEGQDEWGAEFIFDGNDWEEFGNTKVLDGYVTKAEFEEYQEIVQGVADSLQSAIDAEVAAREAGDLAVYNSILGIEDYRIRKLFHEEDVSTKEALVTKIADAPNGSVITLTDDVTVDSLMVVQPGKQLTVEIPAGKTLTVQNERLFSVGVNGAERTTLELVGDGTIEMAYSATNDEPLIFVRGGNTLIVDGPHLINRNPENTSLIQTNGNQSNVNIVIKSGTFEGSLYLPAGGTTTIEGGDFYYGTQVLYCKSGTLNISGGKFNVTSQPDITNGNWAHWNNGNVEMGSSIVIEACNYGGRGNPVVNITGGEFSCAPANDDSYKNYPILVIPYDGNNANMAGTTVSYQKANGVSGHVTTDGKTAPSDGWYKFNDENTSEMVPN